MSEDHFTANRRNWDERVGIHRRDETQFYAVEKVLRGEDKLSAIEAAEIGDVSNLRIAHLQCHFGLDSICLAKRGATVVGLDFSGEAIAAARKLAGETRPMRNSSKAMCMTRGRCSKASSTWFMSPGEPSTGCPTLRSGLRPLPRCCAPAAFSISRNRIRRSLCFEWIEGKIVPHYDWRTPGDKPITNDLPFTYSGAGDRIKNTRTYEWIIR